jgi:hypothetical protein
LGSGAAAPTEAIAASTPEALGAAATPVAEVAAAAAPEALGAAAAPVAEAAGAALAGEAAAGLTAGAEAAAAAAPAAAEFLAMIPLMFSDRRLKDNIKAVGKTFDGQNIYSYNIGNGPTQMGLMAQEVAKKHPDAVGKRNGYMTVDYHEATEDAAHRGHFYGGGLVSRQGHANGERVIADYSEEADLPALGAVETLSEYTPDPRLIQSESGGNWKAENKEIGSGGLKGHFGRSQFGQARLMDAIAAGAIPEGTTPEKFMASPALQMAAEKWHYGNLNDIIDSRGYTGIFGKEINGVPVTRQGLVNVGHLGGPKGLMNFVESGGRYDPQDANKKSLTDYLRLGYASESGGLGAAASKAIDKATSAASGLVPTKKNERGEETTDWKKILIPLATGIAGMAAAPTRNWGTALAMGLGAGAQSFQNIDTKQVEQELKGREVATGEKRASIEDATRRMQLLTQLRQLASGYAQRGESLPPYLKQQIDELSRSLTTSTGSPELAGAAKSGQTTLAGPAKKEEAAPPAEAKPAGEPVVKEGEVPTAPTVASPEPPMPTLSNDFLKKLNPDTNPAELRKRGREAEAFSQGAGKQMFDEAARVEKEMYERGHGLGPKGEIVDIPGWAEYKKAVASQPKIKEFFDAEDAAAQQRVASGQIFRNLDTIFETFKPGKFAEQKAEFQQAVRSLGYTFNGSDMMDADAVQKIAKETTNLVFSDVKGIGGQPRVIEFQQGSKANPEFSLSPEANRAIMADKKAAKAYADKYLNDAYDAYQKEGWRFDVNKFNRTWRESADKIRQEMYDDAYRNTTVRGDVPRDPQDGKVDVNKLKDKHLYIIEPGMGIPDVDRSGQPIKLRWNDKENQFERP